MKTRIEIENQFKDDEMQGEKIISIIRLALAIIFIVMVPLVSVIRKLEGFSYLPWRAHIWNNIFFIYSVLIYIYVKNTGIFHKWFKYICIILDMLIISAAIWVGCTYIMVVPGVIYLSIWSLFYFILILTGFFRYSYRSAYFSAIFASICYLLVVIINKNELDLSYFFELNNKKINISFPVYNEFVRVIGILVTGWLTGLASKRRLSLFNELFDAETAAVQSSEKIVEQTHTRTKAIRKSTDVIFLSSKDVFTTANNQATSIQEIEATIKENALIAEDINEKIHSVAGISHKMEIDVNSSFSVLERNIKQLEDIKSKNDSVIEGIIELGNKINKIREIIMTINTITDQTKVIAFNAALEAASAGDQGKRFSVVAAEVNRLADDITFLTKQIREQTEEIQSSSSTLIISSEESADKITLGNNLIKELEEIFYEIRSGAEITSAQAQTIKGFTEKQKQSSEQITIAIADISEGLSNFIQSTAMATSSAESLAKTTEVLEELLKIKSDDMD